MRFPHQGPEIGRARHDSRSIGLSHYELGLCYRQVGDPAIVREHLTAAASALHAAGDRRYLAMVHSLSGVALAQEGRLEEALVAMRHAERLASSAQAGDVLATVYGNQANVALMQHRHEEALALAERSVELQQESGTPHGLGIALASLGQICVRLGTSSRAEETLNRALDVRSPMRFMRETTGAVFDTLAQIHLIRGEHEEAGRCARTGQGSLRRIRRRRHAAGTLGPAGARGPSHAAPRAGAPALAMANDIASMEAHAGRLRHSGGADRDRGAAHLRRRAANARSGSRRRHADSAGQHERHLGRIPPPPRPGPRRATAAPPTRITTSARASASSSCWASATRPASAIWNSVAWRRRRAPDPGLRVT